MKNTIKALLALFMVVGIWSCTDDDNFKIAAPQAAAFSILTPDSGSTVLITEATPQTNNAITFTWEDVDYGTPTSVTYSVEFAANGTDFAAPVLMTSSTAKSYNITYDALNTVATNLSPTPVDPANPQPVAIDVRVKATVGTTGSEPKYSNVITVSVTPFVPVVVTIPSLFVVGSFQAASGYGNDWTTTTAVPLAASSATGSGSTDFEGYVFMNSTTAQYKFLPTSASFDGDYGDAGPSDGSYTQTLLETGEHNAGLPTPTAGYYLVKANTALLTYSLSPTTWGVIGNGTPGGWDTDTPMTYDPATKKWSVIVTLTDQSAPDNGMKFRANGAWDLNYGDTGADGVLEKDGTNISTVAGTYKVELDLSVPRHYTYTMTLQP